MSENNSHALDLIQRRLAAGDIDGIRNAIFDLDSEGLNLLRQDLGEQSYLRVISSARTRRGRKKGRVIVLHGITGSMLDSVDRRGDADRIWVNPFRLAGGRIEELKLNQDGSPANPDHQIRTNGMHRKTYLPMILELDRGWDVRPFEYDWRRNIERSADDLAKVVQEFQEDKDPVHLVAHSMGGLVSRSFIHRHPEIWKSMYDANNPSAGGRLIMLGTPNHGAFSIVQALTGHEKLLKILALVDITHDMKAIQEILNTFQGSYQMLPSPLVDLGDDHKMLFDSKNWGACPVIAEHLADAKRFHTDMSAVVDPERLVYVAGYNQETAVKIRINKRKPGKFEYLITNDGDGRVPHELGLLRNVPTFWIDEVHGNLPRNEVVLGAMDELLVSGTTRGLERAQDEQKKRGHEVDTNWVPAEQLPEVPPEVATRMHKAGMAERSGASEKLLASEEIEIGSLLADGFLARADWSRSETRTDDGKALGKEQSKKKAGGELPPISMEVVWGDIIREPGNLYMVGHYQGVLPQNAELALDLALSNQLGLNKEELEKEEFIQRQVIRQHSRRGCVRAAVGDVTFFPWATSDGGQRHVAVVGMGHPGSFGQLDLTQMFRDAFLTISLLPGAKTICTVLIGTGEGGLRPDEAVSGLIQGLAEANESADLRKSIDQIKIVEITRNKSRDILKVLKALQESEEQSDIASLIWLPDEEAPKEGKDGLVPTADGLEILIDAASLAMSQTKDTDRTNAINTLLGSMETKESDAAKEALKKFHEARTDDAGGHKTDYVVTEKDNGPVAGRRTRISCIEEGGVMRVAAITNTTTMAEREITAAPDFVRDIVDQVNDPDREPMENLPSFLMRLFFPKDFREILSSAHQYVFEVDRATAQIHWEMLASNLKANDEPLGVSSCVARQLRTQYSAVPSSEGGHHGRGALTALIIGDPGSVQKKHNLPGARNEALAVRKILEKNGVKVTALIGADDGRRNDIPSDVPPATRIAALHEMMNGDYDLLHYSGHGDFNPKAPDQVGWMFERGLLTAHEIRSIDNAPGLIFANACLSARTSEALSADRQVRSARSELGLLPSLADEFFRLGAWNYIGTSWEVNDIGAVKFAEAFYKHLLSRSKGEDGTTVGEAMRKARKNIYDKINSDGKRTYGKLWAAYQHYGDPASRLRRVD